METHKEPSRHEKGIAVEQVAARKIVATEDPTKRRRRAGHEAGARLSPGPRYVATYLLALPVLVVALASTGVAQIVSGLIALTWLALAPIALHARWVANILPISSATLAAVTLLALPFNSAAFVVDLTATVMMFLVAFPRAATKSSIV